MGSKSHRGKRGERESARERERVRATSSSILFGNSNHSSRTRATRHGFVTSGLSCIPCPHCSLHIDTYSHTHTRIHIHIHIHLRIHTQHSHSHTHTHTQRHPEMLTNAKVLQARKKRMSSSWISSSDPGPD